VQWAAGLLGGEKDGGVGRAGRRGGKEGGYIQKVLMRDVIGDTRLPRTAADVYFCARLGLLRVSWWFEGVIGRRLRERCQVKSPVTVQSRLCGRRQVIARNDCTTTQWAFWLKGNGF
jgi:hypothetical protein